MLLMFLYSAQKCKMCLRVKMTQNDGAGHKNLFILHAIMQTN